MKNFHRLVGSLVALVIVATVGITYGAEKQYDKRYQVKYSDQVGKKDHIYGISNKGLWNPLKQQYNAIEWYDEEGGSYSVRWKVNIPESMAGKEYIVSLNFELPSWSENHVLNILRDDEVIESQDLEGDGTIQTYDWTVSFPEAGTYYIELKQKFTGTAMARVANIIYVTPFLPPL